ncbi:protein kinase [Streptomyces qinzhouensis]|uniref:Protein kinase n=1 Tax=Streptomyces qinzhouensis TaxID=2599401 RepID=A0A5B8JFD7_9ACTN|nr:protein kinase [Streptomyces qinzhouensis]QDY78591.1 protein kinase [Streptomyces qinzhouensis]
MDDYAGRVLSDRYRLPLLPPDEYEPAELRAFDTYSGQEVLVRQVPLPETVDAEFVGPDELPGPAGRPGVPGAGRSAGRITAGPADPAVLRAVEAARAAAQVPDHPRLDQVFDVFAEDGSLWIVSEWVEARPLAVYLAEKPLTPYRAAEVASDVLTALGAVHAYGWTHRNITASTVLVCEDGRIVLTGLAAGAAEEALCGYAPVPTGAPRDPHLHFESVESAESVEGAEDTEGVVGFDGEYGEDGAYEEYEGEFADEPDPDDEDGDESEDGEYGEESAEAEVSPGDGGPWRAAPDVRSARSGAIAAYRAGAAAAGRGGDERSPGGGDRPVQSGDDPDWWARKPGAPGPGAADASLPGPPGSPESGSGTARTEQHEGPLYRDHVTTGDDAPEGPGEHTPHHHDPYGHVAYGRDPYGTGGPDALGPAHLTGVWQDGPLPGGDGPRPLSVGGTSAPPPLPVVPDRNPHRYSDPYGVRALPPAGSTHATPPDGTAPGGLPALPVARAGRPGGAPAPRGDRPALPPADPGRDRGGAGPDALRADARRTAAPRAVPAQPAPGRWDEEPAPVPPVHRGPATPLAAERARQARITVVGAVTERWAPEQAGPVHENWQLAAPVGPATDLWALGALLYRSVQGHAPYPEDSAAELVQLVCAEPPAFAEECGPLRPVVESLLRQDPTERPDTEELRGWLRSLIRSAPEPDAGIDVVALPAAPPGGGTRLPIVRRRGELVRKRRGGSTEVVHGRHRHKKPRPQRERGPRSLGRTLLVGVLLLLTGAVLYAVLFMPKADETGDRTLPQGNPRPTPSGAPSPGAEQPGTATPSGEKTSGSATSDAPAAPGSGPLPKGYELRTDPEGFSVAVPKGWQRRSMNDAGQIRYGDGDFTLIVVPGRDRARDGEDPLDYQRDRERELEPFRGSSWSTSSGLRRIEVGQRVMAEGQYTWQDSSGREVYVRNRVVVIEGRYHVLQVIGPGDRRERVSEAYEQAVAVYRKSG